MRAGIREDVNLHLRGPPLGLIPALQGLEEADSLPSFEVLFFPLLPATGVAALSERTACGAGTS